MKISICIPQYNRIAYLLKNLEILEKQTYSEVEIVISDDCSTDDTEQQIKNLQGHYRYPIIYKRHAVNLGYDGNLRSSLELATGDYCFIIGNDDSLNFPEALSLLAEFLQKNNLPEVGFCNMTEASDPDKIFTRAADTTVIGTGPDIAFSYYSCFSFVGGVIYKKSAFDQYNTPKHDGSVYVQMYLSTVMISSGLRLFSIKEALVLKDIQIGGKKSNAYTDKIAKSRKEFKVEQGGLPSVINVLISGFRDAGVLTDKLVIKIFRHIYFYTYTNWVIEYKGKGSIWAALGLVKGLYPKKLSNFQLLPYSGKAEILLRYYFCTASGLLFPYFIFNRLKNRLYAFAKNASR